MPSCRSHHVGKYWLAHIEVLNVNCDNEEISMCTPLVVCRPINHLFEVHQESLISFLDNARLILKLSQRKSPLEGFLMDLLITVLRQITKNLASVGLKPTQV